MRNFRPLVLGWLLDAQLRMPADTAFTVVLAQANARAWRRAAKHFRSKTRVKVHVPGLGMVWHVVLRYERGDALLGKVAGEKCVAYDPLLHHTYGRCENEEEMDGCDEHEWRVLSDEQLQTDGVRHSG